MLFKCEKLFSHIYKAFIFHHVNPWSTLLHPFNCASFFVFLFELSIPISISFSDAVTLDSLYRLLEVICAEMLAIRWFLTRLFVISFRNTSQSLKTKPAELVKGGSTTCSRTGPRLITLPSSLRMSSRLCSHFHVIKVAMKILRRFLGGLCKESIIVEEDSLKNLS